MNLNESEVNTIREVLDDWLSSVDELTYSKDVYPEVLVSLAHQLRLRIAEETGELVR